MPTIKLHPSDTADLAAVESAPYFVASIFLGTGQFDKSGHRTLAAARRTAAEMGAHYRNGRKGMVYAIVANGRSVLVPESYNPKENEMAKVRKSVTAKPAAVKSTDAGTATTGPGKSVPVNGEATATTAKVTKVKTPREPKPPREPKTKVLGARAQIEADAARGVLPAAPDFTADTHKPHRKRLGEVIALVEAGDIAGLREFKINTTSTSPKAIDRYRNLAVIALEAKGREKNAA